MSEALKQTVLRQLVVIRFADASALLNTRVPQRRNAAMYMAGYGVECALKTLICVTRGQDQLEPQFFHHNLWRLAEFTSRWSDLSATGLGRDRLVYIQGEWEVAMRYGVCSYDPRRVLKFIIRAKELTRWLLES
jgi:hypothetical protein